MTDQDAALAFYVGIFGMQKVNDFTYPTGERCLEVSPAKDSSNLCLVSHHALHLDFRTAQMTIDGRSTMPRNTTISASSLLALLGRIHPEAWDFINPYGPILRSSRGASRGEEVALNPQPIPPGVALHVGAAEMAHQLARMAVEANVRGESTDFLEGFIDDWCATPWPRKWPWPAPGPRKPDPSSEIQAARLIGSIVFASIGSRLPDEDLGAIFSKGAERLAEAAITSG
ncbi:MAG: hypothetical protein ABJA87_03100 [bacterium]